MKISSFEHMLRQMDPGEMAQHSIINHHVNGFDYLCLHRSPKLTAKLYIIDPSRIDLDPGQYLVAPHTHRYGFETTVLYGSIDHVRFKECSGTQWRKSEYFAETRATQDCDICNLNPTVEEFYPGHTYFCSSRDIHTLKVPSSLVLLGLMQYEDEADSSVVYKKNELTFGDSRAATESEATDLRYKAMRLLRSFP